MPTLRTQLEEAADTDPGEPVVAATRVLLKGAITSLSVGMAGGLVGAALAHEQMSRDAEAAGAATDLTLAPAMMLGLTDRRVLLWEQKQATGARGDFLGEIPLSDIQGVTFEKKLFGDPLVLTLTNGSTLELKGVKIDRKEGFAAALQARLRS